MSVPGVLTGVDLEDSSPVFSASGQRPEALTREAACLSLELSATAYSMHIAPWQNAGWRDFSILADDDLLTGGALNGSTSAVGGLTRDVMQTLTHMRVTMRGPVTQYLGFKRYADENASACKAVVMSRRAGGRILIAIGFMGTGKRLFDWIPNLRIRPENGYHGGFFQLTEQFFSAAGKIEFPEAAKEMGLPRLTLANVLIYMKTPSSPFRLWVSGHSQGAAVMQVLIDRLVDSGVAENLISGVGFASPSVTEQVRRDGWKLPIRHVLNADDVIPRVGFRGHLGISYFFMPDRQQREEMYRSEWDSPCFQEILRFYRQAEDTGDVLMMSMAALELLRGQSADTVRRLQTAVEQLPAFQDRQRGGSEWTIPVLDGLTAQLREQYIAFSGGADVPEEKLAGIRFRFEEMASQYGLTAWLNAAFRGVTLPHKLYMDPDKGESPASYQYIVMKQADALIPVPDTDVPGSVRRAFEGEDGRR